MYTKYEQTAHYIQQFITEGTPEFAIILGSGLSSLQVEVTPVVEIPYAGIPNFPQAYIWYLSGQVCPTDEWSLSLL